MNFFQPTNREELASALASLSGGSIVAGCTDFLAQRNGKVWHADTILSLTEMQELKQIELAGDTLAVGAVCVHSQVAQSPLVRQYFPALAMACSQVGCAQIRNRGTLGGSIGTSSPAGDVYPPLLALCGAAEVMNSRGAVRTIPARELVLGKGKTALASDEAILRFLLPLPAEHEISAFGKIGERHQVTISKINLAVSAVVKNSCIQTRARSRSARSRRTPTYQKTPRCSLRESRSRRRSAPRSVTCSLPRSSASSRGAAPCPTSARPSVALHRTCSPV